MSAESSLACGEKYPYDATNQDEFLPSTDWAHAAARGVIADLLDRRGIGDALDDIVDEKICFEIVESLAAIIRLAKSKEGITK